MGIQFRAQDVDSTKKAGYNGQLLNDDRAYTRDFINRLQTPFEVLSIGVTTPGDGTLQFTLVGTGEQIAGESQAVALEVTSGPSTAEETVVAFVDAFNQNPTYRDFARLTPTAPASSSTRWP